MGDLAYPLVSDLKREISKSYDVLTEEGVALRGLFIIDREVRGVWEIISRRQEENKKSAEEGGEWHWVLRAALGGRSQCAMAHWNVRPMGRVHETRGWKSGREREGGGTG